MSFDNTEYCGLPLPLERLSEIIAIPPHDRRVKVSYSKSKPMRSIGFLSYISNLEIDADLELSETTFEELSELLNAYMTTKQLCRIDVLNLLTAKCIFEFIGIDTTSIIVMSDLPDNFIRLFIEENKELLTKYFIFISSLVGFGEKILHDNSYVTEQPIYEGVIDTNDWVGTNVVYLFEIPSFFEIFFSVEGIEYPKMYFRVQFEDMCYNGRNLYHYFYDKLEGKNWILATLYSEKE